MAHIYQTLLSNVKGGSSLKITYYINQIYSLPLGHFTCRYMLWLDNNFKWNNASISKWISVTYRSVRFGNNMFLFCLTISNFWVRMDNANRKIRQCLTRTFEHNPVDMTFESRYLKYKNLTTYATDHVYLWTYLWNKKSKRRFNLVCKYDG